MSTKAKSPAPAKMSPSGNLETRFAAALALCQGGKRAEGVVQLEALLPEAEAQPVLARAIRTRLAALAPKAEPSKKQDAGEPFAKATLHLNSWEAEEALQILEKAGKGGKGGARVDYLKATALVQLGRYEEAAAALKAALATEPDLFFTFRMEPDFDSVRRHPAFQNLG